jgi:hypothetical protein
MSDEQEKESGRRNYWREIFFLPPLKMVLTFFDREGVSSEKQEAEPPEKATEKDVEKLIEKLSEKK